MQDIRRSERRESRQGIIRGTHIQRERETASNSGRQSRVSLSLSLSSSSISLSLSVLRHSECVSRGTFLSVQPACARLPVTGCRLHLPPLSSLSHLSLYLFPADARRWRTASSRVFSLLHLSAPDLSPPTLARLSRWEAQQRREQQQLSHEDVRQRDLRCT